jgi:dihydroorotase
LYSKHSPSFKSLHQMTSPTTYHAAVEAAEFLRDNVCPVCFCRKTGKNPRHQLVMHFRRAVDAEHKQFRTQEYRKHFKVGRSKNAVTPDSVYKTLEKRFGTDVAQKYIH